MIVYSLLPPSFKHTATSYYHTAAGTLVIESTDRGIFRAFFIDHQENIAIEQLPDITVLLLAGTDFQIKVWKAALQIPIGTTVTYHDIAQKIGHPTASRAVANALGQNKIAYFVPCHRVVRKDGGLGGYAGGIERKRALLQAEGCKNK